ncbi:hypothetical protein N7452_002706 [Penicillium brevicompactum]|uniref:Rhodopsin domain-containing protein n=1 Tax=Penicillium brevicompactum TaxID=5074 RepID=A0A9W9QSE3_PENBR|nr:hypothetical protein N7452_002706 [Penicillium brevicompactum]
MASLPVPSGLTPPLTSNNETNHNGVITIITSFALSMVLGSLGIRVYSAYSRRVHQLDDLTFAATVVCVGFLTGPPRTALGNILVLAQISTVFVQVHSGWGKTKSLIKNGDLGRMEKVTSNISTDPFDIRGTMLTRLKAGYSADLLYAAILSSSRASTALFYRTITLRSSLWMSYALLATIILSIDIFFEIIMVLYPIRSILRLQTSPSKKITVILVLSCRVLLIPVAAVHLYYIGKQMMSSDPTLEGSYATVLAELHVSLSVVVLTAPLMKPFVAAYVDENGLAYTDDISTSRTKPKLTPRSDRSDETGSRSSQGAPLVGNQIMKSVQISVDREGVELSEIS